MLENHIIKPKKSRKRHRRGASTVTPDNRMRTDILLQIQRDHYVSTAGVDYDKEAVDELVRLRLNKKAELKNARELREFCELERMKEQGKIIDESLESQNEEREFEVKPIEDLLF